MKLSDEEREVVFEIIDSLPRSAELRSYLEDFADPIELREFTAVDVALTEWTSALDEFHESFDFKVLARVIDTTAALQTCLDAFFEGTAPNLLKHV